jgi:hypothetical protein
MTLLLCDFLVVVRKQENSASAPGVSGLSDLSGLGIVLRQPLTTETTSSHPLRRNNKIANKIINKNKKRNDHDKKHKNLTHAVREIVESGQITILHIDGKENLADVCAKALPQAPRERLFAGILGGKSSGK